MIKKIFCFAIILTLTFSCSKKEEKNSPEIAYIKAAKLLKEKNYSEAAAEFEKIDDDFPFSKWAIKGQTMAIYAYYKNEDYTKLIQVSDDFITLNPSSEYVPYVLYMKGVSYYHQIPSIERAQDLTQQASYTFRELIARFPASDYVFDAKEKLEFVDEHLAGAKMSIGRYQISKRHYVGALQNFHEVISRYRYTKQVPEAYFRLAEIYHKIGLKNEEMKIKKYLKLNFSQNHWTRLSDKLGVQK